MDAEVYLPALGELAEERRMGIRPVKVQLLRGDEECRDRETVGPGVWSKPLLSLRITRVGAVGPGSFIAESVEVDEGWYHCQGRSCRLRTSEGSEEKTEPLPGSVSIPGVPDPEEDPLTKAMSEGPIGAFPGPFPPPTFIAKQGTFAFSSVFVPCDPRRENPRKTRFAPPKQRS